jgi:flavin-binding protein dodecin
MVELIPIRRLKGEAKSPDAQTALLLVSKNGDEDKWPHISGNFPTRAAIDRCKSDESSVARALAMRFPISDERPQSFRPAIQQGRGNRFMAKIVKVIEVLSESPKSWEEAVQNVASEASKTLRNIRSIYVKEFTAAVEEGRVTSYRVNAKVTFEMERGSS